MFPRGINLSYYIFLSGPGERKNSNEYVNVILFSNWLTEPIISTYTSLIRITNR